MDSLGVAPQVVGQVRELAAGTSHAAPRRRYRRPEWLRSTILRVAAVAILVNVVVSGRSSYLWASWLPTWASATVFAVIALAALPILLGALRASPKIWPAQVYVAAIIATNLLILAVPKSAEAPPGPPYFVNATIVAVCLAAVGFRRRRRAAVLVALLGVTDLAVRAEASSWSRGLPDTTSALLVGLVCGIYARVLENTYALSERLEDERLHARESAAQREAAQRARAEWDRIIHDKVLGALLLASRSATFSGLATARELAGDALRALGVLDQPAGGIGSIAVLADRWGVAIDGAAELPEGLPEEVAEGVLSAVSESLANVARHSGTTAATVRVTGDSAHCVVTIADAGRGFDLGDPRHRFGLTRSIPGHMAAVGGRAEVDSAPGMGTTVTLSWSAPPTALPELRTGRDEWLARIRPLQRALPAAWFIACLTPGVFATRGLWPDEVLWPVPVWALVVLLGISVAWGSVAPPRIVPWAILGAGVGVFGLAALTPVPVASDWRYWFVGGSVPLGLSLAVEGRRPAVWAAVASTSIGLFGGMAFHGRLPPFLPELIVQPAFFVVLALIGVRGMERAIGDVRASADGLLAIRQAEHALAVQEDLARQRREQLSRDVIPLLLRLWHGEVLTERDRLDAAVTEAGARDRLTGGPLVDEHVADSARLARTRGAKIVLSCPADASSSPALAAFRQALACGLQCCGAGSRLTARWNPGDTRRLGTLSVISPRLPFSAPNLHDALLGQDHTLEVLDEEVWLEVRPHGTEIASDPAGLSPEGVTAPGWT